MPACTSGNNVRLVTGVPYSGLGTSETTFTLPDGRRVVRQNLIRQWRDSDGRTRSEISLSTIGGSQGGSPEVEVNTTVTVIDDPTHARALRAAARRKGRGHRAHRALPAGRGLA